MEYKAEYLVKLHNRNTGETIEMVKTTKTMQGAIQKAYAYIGKHAMLHDCWELISVYNTEELSNSKYFRVEIKDNTNGEVFNVCKMALSIGECREKVFSLLDERHEILTIAEEVS